MLFKTKYLYLPKIKEKRNENNDSKYILVVASVTTPTVVREQCSYVYTSIKVIRYLKEPCRNLRQGSFRILKFQIQLEF